MVQSSSPSEGGVTGAQAARGRAELIGIPTQDQSAGSANIPSVLARSSASAIPPKPTRPVPLPPEIVTTKPTRPIPPPPSRSQPFVGSSEETGHGASSSSNRGLRANSVDTPTLSLLPRLDFIMKDRHPTVPSEQERLPPPSKKAPPALRYQRDHGGALRGAQNAVQQQRNA